MGASSPRYPREFRKVLRHADRFSKVLVRLAGDAHAASWVVGRSGELRAFVSCAIADWRAGALDHDSALGATTSYVDGLRRGRPSGCIAVRRSSAAGRMTPPRASRATR